MTYAQNLPVNTIIQHCYYQDRDLDKLLTSMLEHLSDLGGYTSLTLTMQNKYITMTKDVIGLGSSTHRCRTVGACNGGRLSLSCDCPSTVSNLKDKNGNSESTNISISEEIRYGSIIYGNLGCVLRRSTIDLVNHASLLKTFSTAISHFVTRQHVFEWTKHQLGRPFFLIGASPALHRLENDIEKVSKSALPVLIQGEQGTEKTYTALAIHASSDRQMYPFIEIDCGNDTISFSEQMRKAHRGCLYLNNIHLLTIAQQYELRCLLFSQLEQWTFFSDRFDVRFISSSSEDILFLREKGLYLADLLAELSILSISVPPLRHRKDDIQSLIDELHLRFTGTNNKNLYQDVNDLILDYHWPGNLCDLAKVVATLGTMSDGNPISFDDVQRHTPWLLTSSIKSPKLATDLTNIPIILDLKNTKIENQAVDTIQEKLSQSVIFHNGVSKAINFISENFKNSISLDDLARFVNLSPSYLSFLFKKELGFSFKHVQHYLRIQEAKNLLCKNSHTSISDVSEMVGYASLCQFESYFRKMEGRTPREYRRSFQY